MKSRSSRIGVDEALEVVLGLRDDARDQVKQEVRMALIVGDVRVRGLCLRGSEQGEWSWTERRVPLDYFRDNPDPPFPVGYLAALYSKDGERVDYAKVPTDLYTVMPFLGSDKETVRRPSGEPELDRVPTDKGLAMLRAYGRPDFERNCTGAPWTPHLRVARELLVRREDVLRAFGPPVCEQLDPFKSGLAGRPTPKYAAIAEMERRASRGEMRLVLAEEARYLVDWLRRTHSCWKHAEIKPESLAEAIRSRHAELKPLVRNP